MTRRIGDLLAEQAATRMVGRKRELTQLLCCLDTNGPAVTQLHGIGGSGKSTLLAAFCARAREAGAEVVQLDCRTIEPTERGFLHELGDVLGLRDGDTGEAAEGLGALSERVVFALDTYERLRLLDTWLRQVFVPALPDNVRVILSGREPPVTSWLTTPGWQGLFHTIALGPLDEDDAITIFTDAGIERNNALRMNRFARGHPLALALAAAAALERPNLELEETALTTEQLTSEGRVFGTVAYMSPEQVNGKRLDARSDIFSLGVMLYEMTTGHRPFGGETSAELMSSILRDTPPPITEVRVDLPDHLGRILRRCLEKDPNRRCQSALDLRNELEDLKSEPARSSQRVS